MKSIVEHIYKKKGIGSIWDAVPIQGPECTHQFFQSGCFLAYMGLFRFLGKQTSIKQSISIQENVNQHQRSRHKTLEFLDQRSKPHVVRSNLLIRGFWESSRWFMIMVLHLLEIKHMVSGHVLLEMKQLVTDRSSTSFGNQKSGW